MSSAPPSPHLSIQCVNIFVRNHDRSIRFFVDQLDFHLAYDAKLQSGERLIADVRQFAPPRTTRRPHPDHRQILTGLMSSICSASRNGEFFDSLLFC